MPYNWTWRTLPAPPHLWPRDPGSAWTSHVTPPGEEAFVDKTFIITLNEANTGVVSGSSSAGTLFQVPLLHVVIEELCWHANLWVKTAQTIWSGVFASQGYAGWRGTSGGPGITPYWIWDIQLIRILNSIALFQTIPRQQVRWKKTFTFHMLDPARLNIGGLRLFTPVKPAQKSFKGRFCHECFNKRRFSDILHNCKVTDDWWFLPGPYSSLYHQIQAELTASKITR